MKRDHDRFAELVMPSYGFGIPRLQELSFLEITAKAVSEGASFEEIRQRLIDHMIALRESNPASGNVATFRLAMENPARYVRNVSDALKELMRLGMVQRATLPSSASAARSYRNTTFALTEGGMSWIATLDTDIRVAYDTLLQMLWKVHPQFAGYVRSLSQFGLTIPLAQWGEIREPRNRNRYVDFLVERVTNAVAGNVTGWSAEEKEIRDAIAKYTMAISTAASSRTRQDPFPRNQDFVRTCEESLVKFAFSRCGLALDYISHEILRRWTKELGIANFSYHVPGPPALRLWPTASLSLEGETLQISRHGGPELRNRVLDLLAEAYERARRVDPQRSMFVPIYRVRADICWKLRISDAVFDRALTEFIKGGAQTNLPFRINLDPAQYGSLPPTELPLRIPHAGRINSYYCLSLVPQHNKPISSSF